MFKPHAASVKEIDYYRQEMSTEQYIKTLKDLSVMYHEFYYKDKLIAIAGVIPGVYANYWQFLSEDFPSYIPMSFLKEYLTWGSDILSKFDVTCNVFKENRFALWLIHHGKKRRGWKVLKVNNGRSFKFFIKRGGD